MKRIAIYASGGGSNALKIMKHFAKNDIAEVALVITNNPHAGVIEHSIYNNIPTVVLEKEDIASSETQLKILNKYAIDFIALAGYLKAIPTGIVNSFPDLIVNIHPALLPKYGGKGMFGMNVHRAVKENQEEFSGPTIHLVNEEYDKGEILFQTKINLSPSDSAEEIAAKVLRLEHEHYAPVIEHYIRGL